MFHLKKYKTVLIHVYIKLVFRDLEEKKHNVKCIHKLISTFKLYSKRQSSSSSWSAKREASMFSSRFFFWCFKTIFLFANMILTFSSMSFFFSSTSSWSLHWSKCVPTSRTTESGTRNWMLFIQNHSWSLKDCGSTML